MLAFTVHEPPSAPADKLDRAEQIVFVRDGFSLYGAAFGSLWLLFNGLWLAAAIAIGTTALLAALLYVLGAGFIWILAVLAAVHLVIGFEARNIERWTLNRRGWSMLGSVSGRDIEECERRFFEAWLPKQPFVTQANLNTPGEAFRTATNAAAEPRSSLLGRLMRRT